MRRPWLAAALAALAVTGCFKDWSDPRVVLTRFLEAWYEQDFEEVYEHLCAADRAYRSLEDYVALHGTEDSVVVGPLLQRSSFEIESLDTEAFRARARVQAREPNMSLVMDDMMNEALRAIVSGETPADFDRALERRYAHTKIPMKVRRKVYTLVQEEGRWKVDLRWPVEMLPQAEQTRRSQAAMDAPLAEIHASSGH